jgi:hypothetical protein
MNKNVKRNDSDFRQLQIQSCFFCLRVTAVTRDQHGRGIEKSQKREADARLLILQQNQPYYFSQK